MTGPDRKLLVTGIYTLTPTHCGTGQAAGAVDLPIAREAHTGLPLIPASSLKGIARDDWFPLPGDRGQWTEQQERIYQEVVKPLFGPLPPPRGKQNGSPSVGEGGGQEQARDRREAAEDLSAGELVFLDGLLLAFPVRSLTGGFRLATSPLLLQRLRRMALALGAKMDDSFTCPEPGDGQVLLPPGQSGPLSLEDLVYARVQCRPDAQVKNLADALGRFVAREAKDADRVALHQRLVVVRDEVLQDLSRRATSVAARIVLNDRKTSDNLWYEESLPPDCLFAAVVAARPGVASKPIHLLDTQLSKDERYTQIGGNATVGYGQCRWVFRPAPEVLV